MAERQDADMRAWITVKAAAEMLNVSRSRIYQFIDEGRLTARQIGNMFVLQRAEVERFAEQERQTGRPPKSD